ncbi:reverse transcriptase domain-containing protein [Tanacetum coccineum]
MATVNQGMSVEEIEQIVAQRVTNAIETIAIYEAQTNIACKSLNQAKHQEDKVSGNTSNKRKWEGDQNRSPNQQQNKEHKVFRAHAVGPKNKKEYLGSLPLCNECKFHHIGQCAARCGNCKWRGHQAKDCRIPGPKAKPRPSMEKLKAERQAENKRKLDNNNQAQQQSPKRQNVAQAYAARTSKRKEYAGTLPLCNRCKLHHNGPCTIECGNCKKVGHMTRDCRNLAAARNQRTLTCYECGNPRHYRSDCLELKN